MRQLLQPITAFAYCNRQAPLAGASRPPAAGDTTIDCEQHAFQAPAVACSTEHATELRTFSKIILFHFMMEPSVK